jgi:hypothetical protein
MKATVELCENLAGIFVIKSTAFHKQEEHGDKLWNMQNQLVGCMLLLW